MNDMTAGYVKSALDYRALEYRCDLFSKRVAGYRIFRNPSFYYNCFLTDKVLS